MQANVPHQGASQASGRLGTPSRQGNLFGPRASYERAAKHLIGNRFRLFAKGFCSCARITVLPGVPNSAQLDDIAEPPDVVRARSWCARWRSASAAPIARSSPATTARRPPASERLILGHESLGEVIAGAAGSGFAAGDLVVGIVRRPDPVPCPACAAGEWDMCRNGRYTERGIKGLHGFGAERFRIEPEFAVKVDPALGALGVLLEPASVVAKAWDHIERIGRRFRSWQPRRAAGHRRRPDRPARGADRRAARTRRACARPQRRRAEAGARPRARRAPTTPARSSTLGDSRPTS